MSMLETFRKIAKSKYWLRHVCLSVCLSVSLSVCLSVCLSATLPVRPSAPLMEQLGPHMSDFHEIWLL